MLNIIQQLSRFVRIQPYDGFIMQLWHVHQQNRIRFYHFTFVIIVIKAPKSGHFALQATFAIGLETVVLGRIIDLEIFLKFFNIDGLELIQYVNGKIIHRFVFKGRIF